MARRKNVEEEYEDEAASDDTANSKRDFRKRAMIPAILALFVVASWLAWRAYRDSVVTHPAYLLNTNNIVYTEQPDWIKEPILPEVIKIGGLESKSITEQDLTLLVMSAFEHHPWVSQVERVRPSYPPKFHVELTYRKPVAMVLKPDDNPNDDIAYIYPIDAESVLLPADDFKPDFRPNAAEEFPRINVWNGEPSGPAGSGWGDNDVLGAAQIAGLLYEDWENISQLVFQIELTTQPSGMGTEPEYDLVARPELSSNGQPIVIRWGHAPGKEGQGEPTAEAKLNMLEAWVHEAKMRNRLPVPEIDLRTHRALQAAAPTPPIR